MGTGKSLCCKAVPAAAETAPEEGLTLRSFKEKLEGSRRRMKDKPEVWVTVKEVVLREECLGAKLNPSFFSLEDVLVRTSVQVCGSSLQIVQELGSLAALKLMDKVGVDTSLKRGGSEFSGKMPTGAAPSKALGGHTSLIEVRERAHHDGPDKVAVGSGTWDKGLDSRTFDVNAIISIFKELNEEEVHVSAQHLDAVVHTGKTTLQSDSLQKHIEVAVGKLATELLRGGDPAGPTMSPQGSMGHMGSSVGALASSVGPLLSGTS